MAAGEEQVHSVQFSSPGNVCSLGPWQYKKTESMLVFYLYLNDAFFIPNEKCSLFKIVVTKKLHLMFNTKIDVHDYKKC